MQTAMIMSDASAIGKLRAHARDRVNNYAHTAFAMWTLFVVFVSLCLKYSQCEGYGTFIYVS